MRVVQTIGVPAGAARGGRRCRGGRAQVAHHRRRRGGRAVARRAALAARQGARQFYFKYCSTFDSTPRGNIGPVTEALMDALGAGLHDRPPGVPRERAHGLQGPPLRRRRAAQRQRHAQPPAHADDRRQPGARAAGAARDDACGGARASVGLVDHAASRPSEPSRARFAALRAEGVRIAIVDAVSNDDLLRLGAARERTCRS